MNTVKKNNLAHKIALTILRGYERHFRIFSEITHSAKQRFEEADWEAERLKSRLRIRFYDKRVDETVDCLSEQFDVKPIHDALWHHVKSCYILLLQNHKQPELAETFFNSVFCRLFPREYFTNHFIFVRSSVSTQYIESDIPVYHTYYPAETGLLSVIRKGLSQFNLNLPFDNLARDSRYIAYAIFRIFNKHRNDQRYKRKAHLNFQIQVMSRLFFRNKAAYIVGKAINGHEEYPFAIPLLTKVRTDNRDLRLVYVDAFLMGENAIARLFSFSYAYFMVAHPVPSAIVSFLGKLMPQKKIEALYSSIGFHKQGKNDFYRGFLHHLNYSSDQFILAPGIPGMVMSVFTLPSYPYVFKIIRDRFAPPKEISHKEVEEKYQLVKQHDRVGRMADMQEYSHVSLPLARFTPELLKDLQETCESNISIQRFPGKVGHDRLMIEHVYIERRMLPLNLELELAEKAGDNKRIEQLILSYGNAIKELSGANIFPGDLLYKNFGVTRLNRVVFYDYDEIVYLTDCHFRKIPAPRHPEDLMASEPWYSVAANDIFPEEFGRFLLNNAKIKKYFMRYHADLLDVDYWIRTQKNIKKGVFQDVFPYPEKHRFSPDVS